MLVNIDGKPMHFDRTSVPEHWGFFFAFEKEAELYDLSKQALIKEINKARALAKPFIDSKVTISDILTAFGANHIFHRKFNEILPGAHKEQVLGMQLYYILITGKDDTWHFSETLKKGHKYPNAVYWK
jgi:hypothetical protein